jgi:hypothetical protein
VKYDRKMIIRRPLYHAKGSKIETKALTLRPNWQPILIYNQSGDLA